MLIFRKQQLNHQATFNSQLIHKFGAIIAFDRHTVQPHDGRTKKKLSTNPCYPIYWQTLTTIQRERNVSIQIQKNSLNHPLGDNREYVGLWMGVEYRRTFLHNMNVNIWKLKTILFLQIQLSAMSVWTAKFKQTTRGAVINLTITKRTWGLTALQVKQ